MSRAYLKMLHAFSAINSMLLYVLRTLLPCVLIGKEDCLKPFIATVLHNRYIITPSPGPVIQ